jgi:hypothetical protein
MLDERRLLAVSGPTRQEHTALVNGLVFARLHERDNVWRPAGSWLVSSGSGLAWSLTESSP